LELAVKQEGRSSRLSGNIFEKHPLFKGAPQSFTQYYDTLNAAVVKISRTRIKSRVIDVRLSFLLVPFLYDIVPKIIDKVGNPAQAVTCAVFERLVNIEKLLRMSELKPALIRVISNQISKAGMEKIIPAKANILFLKLI
jgi:hypothetical protein